MMRFYLLMAVVIIGLFAGIPALALLALPIFIITILGAEFSFEKKRINAQVTQLQPKNKMRQAS